MASWQIEQFRVRHSGEHSRYAAVYTDENGNVSVQPVPSQPFPNLCVSAYRYNYRTFPSSVPATPANQKTASLITEYCNLDTFTNYRIYAQDCAPFAYAETDLNAPKCGYLEPIEEPASPPNPYGTLYYQDYKYTEFCNNKGETIRVDIKRKHFYTMPQTVLEVDSFEYFSTPVFGPPTMLSAKVFVNRLDHSVFYTGNMQLAEGTNRTYAPDELITEICDFSTGTNLKVYAQVAPPFAYLVEDLDNPSCALPTQEPEYVENWGDEPVVLSYKGDDNKLSPVTPCECVLNFLCTEDFSLEEFYTNDEREFKVIVSVDGATKFEGFIIPDSCQEPFLPTPYQVTIRATDAIGAMKSITYPIPYTSKSNLRQSFLEIIAFCLSATNLSLNIRTICNVYETKMLNGPDDDPLVQGKVNPLRFTGENGNLLDCYQVLEAVLLLFKANIRQSNGEWVINRQDELAQEVTRTRVYNNKAFFLYSEVFNPIREITTLSDDTDFPFGMDQNILIGNAYKRASVLTEFAKSPAMVFNGDFEQFDGQNFSFWTKFGGMNVERVQKTIPGTGLARIPIEDYACQFNERAQSGKWLQSNDILIELGDSVQLAFSHSPFFAVGSIKIRVKLGEYYLTNAVNGTDFQWVKSLSTITLKLETNVFQSGRTNVRLTMPEAPVSGIMVLQFFGPQQYDVQYTSGGQVIYVENTNYNPLDIDNVAVNRSQKVDQKLPDGTIHISEQGGFYTKKPEQLKVLFGDYEPTFSVILGLDISIIQGNFIFDMSGNLDTSVVTDNLHAIYTADNYYSSTWYEYGTSSGRIPIGLLLAKGILKSHQKPYKYISGSFYVENALSINTFRFVYDCIPEFSQKIFSLLSCDVNLKSNTLTSVNMVEIFDKYVKTVDISQPHHPGDVEPPISANPNTPPLVPTEGIFTDEFTDEFL